MKGEAKSSFRSTLAGRQGKKDPDLSGKDNKSVFYRRDKRCGGEEISGKLQHLQSPKRRLPYISKGHGLWFASGPQEEGRIIGGGVGKYSVLTCYRKERYPSSIRNRLSCRGGYQFQKEESLKNIDG